MKPIPWRYVSSWDCIACGLCCRGYDIVLKYPEWVRIIQIYGVGVTRPGLNRFYLGKTANDSCIFLYGLYDRWLCGLQHMKPRACKLWPFKIFSYPKYGRPNQASYEYRNKEFFVYVDPKCIGLTFEGEPSKRFVSKIVPEVVELALGLREEQFYSTSKMSSEYLKFGARKIV